MASASAAGNPDVLALDERDRGRGQQQADGGRPGQRHPPRQRHRQHDQRRPDQRRQELPGLRRDLGQVGIDEAVIGPRLQHAQAQQQHAAQRHRAGRRRHREVGLAPARPRSRPRRRHQVPAAQEYLVAREQAARQEQRDDVVEQAEDQHRANDLRRLQVRRQAHQHRAVEHAETRGQACDQPRAVAGEVHREQPHIGQMRRCGQQRVDDGRGDRHVHGRQQHLRQRHAPMRQLDLVAEQTQLRGGAGQRDIGPDHRPQHDAQCIQRPVRQVVAQERHRAGLAEQDGTRQHHPAQPEGQAAERDELRDLERRQPPIRIQPVAHRRPRHRGETEVVRQRIGAERGERGLGLANRVARVDGAEPVVEGQHAVRDDGPKEREHQRPMRDRRHRVPDVVELEVAELLLDDVDRAHQQRHAQHRRQMAGIAGQASGHAATCRASACSIRATVSAMPYSATNWPSRGPSSWPSST